MKQKLLGYFYLVLHSIQTNRHLKKELTHTFIVNLLKQVFGAQCFQFPVMSSSSLPSYYYQRRELSHLLATNPNFRQQFNKELITSKQYFTESNLSEQRQSSQLHLIGYFFLSYLLLVTSGCSGQIPMKNQKCSVGKSIYAYQKNEDHTKQY